MPTAPRPPTPGPARARRGRRVLAVLVAAVALVAAACGDDGSSGGGDALEIYSGRNEALVGPLLERFADESGIDVRVRYGDSTELAGAILEEGGNSPADVFFSQDAGALGALDDAGLLAALASSELERVEPAFRAADGTWVGVSGRVRVVAYNTRELRESDLPSSVLGFTDPRWKGRLGWAPTNASFQAFVTALRVLEGEDGAEAWLEGVKANNPRKYANNIAIVEAVSNGEIDAGFVNHYYVYQLQSQGKAPDAANKYYTGGDPGALVNVAGVGVLRSGDNRSAADEFVRFLLSVDAQRYFADETFEIPLADDVPAAPQVPPLSSAQHPDIDLGQLDDLQGTLDLLTRTGVL